ncbi:hypothetical protein GGR50DRAFT_519077 [Xylaria sp. CBS 124048]|nr:hypothetical protein GGR50DRAFT_519077 [Xylaria sp. CBS 124048]
MPFPFLRPNLFGKANGVLPDGCRIPIEPASPWPVNRTISHVEGVTASFACDCKGKAGGDHDIVRDYLFVIAYEHFYKKDPKKYDAVACNEMVISHILRLGLDLEGLDFWTRYPESLPPRPSR